MTHENIVLCGPPGVGKTAVGEALAARLGRPFLDSDALVQARHGRPIPDYFAAGEEPLFRAREAALCRELAAGRGQVIAVGGGALLDPHSRAALEATGTVICLRAPADTLLERLAGGPARPLLAGDGDPLPERNLARLLEARAGHYASFPLAVDSGGQGPEETALAAARMAAAEAGRARFWLNGHTAVYGAGLLSGLAGWLAEAGLLPPLAFISDDNVARLIAVGLARSLDAPLLTFPAGEAHKTLETARALYTGCLSAGMERGGTLVAVGGGVVGDVAGFVAATLLRGVRWANLPTSVLALADAALGGKTGVDLPEGKNLVGAFHPPALVLADFDTLATLPPAEARSGLAEVIKAGVVGDPGLLLHFTQPERLPLAAALTRAAGVKVGIVNADPFERGERAKLNLGHTVGHGVEAASDYRLRHGEAIAVGLVAEARLAEELGLAARGLAGQLAAILRGAGLPTRCPGLAPGAIRAAMSADKKKAGGQLRFALPAAPGDVRTGVVAPEGVVLAVLAETVEVE